MHGSRSSDQKRATSLPDIATYASRVATSDDGLAAFVHARPRLFGIAYRMVGSVAEAEDLVQDVWLRWQTANRSEVRDATAYLVTTTTRAAISGRSRRDHGARPTWARRCPSRSTPATTRPWAPSAARR
jgi:RNA polymerase sigma-70 factor (ECF subfamily)